MSGGRFISDVKMGRGCNCCVGCKYKITFIETIEIGEVDFTDSENPTDNIGNTVCFYYLPWKSPFQARASFLNKDCVDNIPETTIDKCACVKTYPMVSKIVVKNNNNTIISDDTSYIGIDTIEYSGFSDGCRDGKYHRDYFQTLGTLRFINDDDNGETVIKYTLYKTLYGTNIYYKDKIINKDGSEVDISEIKRKLYIIGPVLSNITFSNRNLTLSAYSEKCNPNIYFINNTSSHHAYVYDTYDPLGVNTPKGYGIAAAPLLSYNPFSVNFNNEIYDSIATVYYPIRNRINPPNTTVTPNRSTAAFTATLSNKSCEAAYARVVNFEGDIKYPNFFQLNNTSYTDTDNKCGGINTLLAYSIGATQPIISIHAPNEVAGWSMDFGGKGRYPLAPIAYETRWSSIDVNRFAGIVQINLISDYFFNGGTPTLFSVSDLDYTPCAELDCNYSSQFYLNPNAVGFKKVLGSSASLGASIGDLAYSNTLGNKINELWQVDKKIAVYFSIYGIIYGQVSSDFGNQSYGTLIIQLVVAKPFNGGVFINPNGNAVPDYLAPAYYKICNGVNFSYSLSIGQDNNLG
jgi:hypothetical protein